MHIFISWSGPHGKQIAESFKLLLTNVLNVTPDEAMISTKLPKGTNWRTEVFSALNKCEIGIVCITPDSVDSRWLLFEGGALALKNDIPQLHTLLCGLTPAKIEEPFASFQHTLATEKDVLTLLTQVNESLPRPKRTEQSVLQARFNGSWETFKTVVDCEVEKSNKAAPPKREMPDMVEEILENVRTLTSHPTLKADIKHLKLLTSYIGEFPDIFDDVVQMVSGATRSIRIICDFLAYGTFTDAERAEKYRDVIKARARGENGRPAVSVEIIIPNDAHQRHLEELQFGRGEEGWKRQIQDSEFCRKLKEVNDNILRYSRDDRTITNMKEFQEYFYTKENKWMKELKSAGVIVKPIEELPTTFCWIVDEEEAIFSIPLFGEDAHEQGFRTYDKRLLQTFKAMCDYYGSGRYLLRAEPYNANESDRASNGQDSKKES